ncbi:hypothetical protein HDV00_011645 [Rhizophlyctis rosea]|nr:hypothetical protein HDV00_011645 [Rhizophlyctis rosea]
MADEEVHMADEVHLEDDKTRIHTIMSRARRPGGIPWSDETIGKLTTWFRTLLKRGCTSPSFLRDADSAVRTFEGKFPNPMTRCQYTRTFLTYLSALTDDEFSDAPWVRCHNNGRKQRPQVETAKLSSEGSAAEACRGRQRTGEPPRLPRMDRGDVEPTTYSGSPGPSPIPKEDSGADRQVEHGITMMDLNESPPSHEDIAWISRELTQEWADLSEEKKKYLRRHMWTLGKDQESEGGTEDEAPSTCVVRNLNIIVERLPQVRILRDTKGTRIGFVLYADRDVSETRCDMLWTHPSHRRQGYGTLLKECVPFAVESLRT